jgi:prepilin-type processing-associated H-X9-DG protein
MEISPEEPLASDMFLDTWSYRGGDPAHIGSEPYGVNVAYADGHAAWVTLGAQELRRLDYYAYTPSISLARLDGLTYEYFKAIKTQHFHDLDQNYPAP